MGARLRGDLILGLVQLAQYAALAGLTCITALLAQLCKLHLKPCQILDARCNVVDMFVEQGIDTFAIGMRSVAER